MNKGSPKNSKLTTLLAEMTQLITAGEYDKAINIFENNKNDFAIPLYIIKKENLKPDKTLTWINPDGKYNVS